MHGSDAFSNRTISPGTMTAAIVASMSTTTCPRSPCARATVAMRTNDDMSPTGGCFSVARSFTSGLGWEALLLEDLEDDFTVRSRRGCIEDGAQRLGGTSLLADHAAEIFFVDAQSQNPLTNPRRDSP